MILFPGAKINLGLHVLKKRGDGFHDIETVMYPIPLTDILEVIVLENRPGSPAFEKVPGSTWHEMQGRQVCFKLSGLPVAGEPAGNLVLKACERGIGWFPTGTRLYVHLRKVVPTGAGLGGGSADASATLMALHQLSGTQVEPEILESLAATLGSDCPFFVANRPALATGRGELMTPIDVDLKSTYLLVVKPDFSIATHQAYAQVKPGAPEKSLPAVLAGDRKTWRNQLKNDFETALQDQHPEIRSLCNRMYASGAWYASMTGSGSAVYGLFDNPVADRELFPDAFRFSARLN